MKAQGLAEKKPRLQKSDELPIKAIRDPDSLDKAGLSLRSERAKYLRTIRKEHRELQAEINRDRFLQEWC